MAEYLTTDELSERIKMAPGTIRNLVYKKELKENIHYVKPTSRKLLFMWDAILEWLHRRTGGAFVLGYSRPEQVNTLSIQ